MAKRDYMELLDQLLESENFESAVSGLAADFRKAHGLPEVHQLGVVVPDVEKAASLLEDRGLGPFFIASGAPSLWKEKGEDRRFSGKLGIAYHQGIEIELLEPGDGSDFYGQHLDPEGRPIVQHLGLLVDDVDEGAARLEEKGFPVYVRGRIKTGPMATDFAYMDTMQEAGYIVEFISWKLAGRPFSLPAWMFRLLGRIEKASGIRSIKT